MKRAIGIGSLLAGLAVPGVAGATAFELTVPRVSANTVEPSLALETADLPALVSLSLTDPGPAYTSTAFRIGTWETAVNRNDLTGTATGVVSVALSNVLFGVSGSAPVFSSCPGCVPGRLPIGDWSGPADSPICPGCVPSRLPIASWTDSVHSPEPGTLLLLGSGIMGLIGCRQRRNVRRQP